MTASAVGYEHVQEWVKTRLGRTQATVVQTVAWAVLCLLLAQRVTPAALARAMPAEQAGTMGGLAGRHCRGGPYAPDRLGRHPLPLAQRAVPHHDFRAH